MKKNILRKAIIGLIFTVILLSFNTELIYAASNTKTVTTEKQLTAALSNKKITKIIIKPTKTTVFTIGKKKYNKELVVFQNKTTLINKGKFNKCEIIVTNTKQAKEALKYINKYHRSDKNILHIMNAQSNILLPRYNLSSYASLLIEKCNFNITNKCKWKSIEITNMGAGGFIEYGNRNKINVTGKVKKITVAENVKTTQIFYNQKEKHGTTSNMLVINGNIGKIMIKSSLDMHITGSKLENIESTIRNETDGNITVYINEKKYIFDRHNNIVTKKDKASKKEIFFDDDKEDKPIDDGYGEDGKDNEVYEDDKVYEDNEVYEDYEVYESTGDDDYSEDEYIYGDGNEDNKDNKDDQDKEDEYINFDGDEDNSETSEDYNNDNYDEER